MLYPIIGCLVTVFIGIVVSLVTSAVCPDRSSYDFLRQGGYVFVAVCVSVCVSVCLCTKYLKTL